MEEEYITKEQALDAVIDGIKDWRHSDFYFAPYDCVLKTIIDLDSAGVVPVVHGDWIESDHGSYICSVCGEDWMLYAGTPEENHMNYCPRCGARMGGE